MGLSQIFVNLKSFKAKLMQIKELFVKSKYRKKLEVDQELKSVRQYEEAYKSKRFSYGQKDEPERDVSAI